MAFPVKKFKELCHYQFNIEIVTPLFAGGADGIQAELRAAALKGLMRFWWRALYGSDNIEKMKENEAKIFGDTDRKSDVKISLENTKNLQPVKTGIKKGTMFTAESKGRKFTLSITEYLAYGLYEYQKGKGNVFIREHFKPTSDTSLSLILSCSLNYKEQIINTLKALYMFGGLGAKSRNGFGNISIKDKGKNKEFSDDNPEKFFLKKVTGQKRNDFSSFSQDAKLFLFQEQNSWDMALSDAGLAYKSGRNNLENRHSFNRRQLVAKPIIVKGEVTISDRHTKPYFLHVHKMANGKFRGQILFLPYNYYEKAKLIEYDKACNDMNNSIITADNFSKEISASKGV